MRERIETIDAATLRGLLEQGAALLIDVREIREHASAHIPGAVLKPLSGLNVADLPEADGKTVVVSCASGMRSLAAADRLLADHYGGVSNLDGGIGAWQRAGYEVARDESGPAGVMPGLFSMFRGGG